MNNLTNGMIEAIEKHTGIMFEIGSTESKEVTAIKLIAINSELENKCGWQSCYDVPEAYDLMEDVSTVIHQIVQEIARNNGDRDNTVLKENVLEVLDNAAEYFN